MERSRCSRSEICGLNGAHMAKGNENASSCIQKCGSICERKKMENNQRLHSNKLIYNQQKNPQNIMDGHSKCEKYTSMNQHQTYNKNSTNVNCVNVRPPNCVRPATWIEGNQLVRDSVVVLFGVRFKFNSTINLWKCSHCKSRAVGTTDHYSFNLFTDFLVVVAALKWSDYISHNAEQFHVQIFFLFKTHHNKIIIKFHSHRVPVVGRLPMHSMEVCKVQLMIFSVVIWLVIQRNRGKTIEY